MLRHALPAARKTLRVAEALLLFPLLVFVIGPRKAAALVLDEAGIAHD